MYDSEKADEFKNTANKTSVWGRLFYAEFAMNSWLALS